MERPFAMPDLGEGLEEGRIVAWLVREGDPVALNQPLVEVETAKAAVEIPSPFAGVVRRLHAAEGADVPVGGVLVTVEVEDAPEAAAPGGARAGAPAAAPVRAAPAVRRLAKDLGIDLTALRGSGPAGRITEADVRASAGVGTEPGVERPSVDPVRREIAARLTAQAAIPQVTTFRTLDATALASFRADLGVAPLPVVVAALCTVIAEHPIVNARWVDGAVEYRTAVHVGIAVDTDRGLMVPVVRDAATRTISDLAAEIRRLADAARAGTLSGEDLASIATVAVSNTGSYGSEAGTPILSPGTSVTLALGAIAPRALVVDGAVEPRPAATLSLTFDHRVLDGAAAGRFLTDLVAVLQSQDRLRDLPR